MPKKQERQKIDESLNYLKKRGPFPSPKSNCYADINQVSGQLEKEGIEKFNKAFSNLLNAIKEKSGKA